MALVAAEMRAYSTVMTDDRAMQAIDRIETALARIEVASATARDSTPNNDNDLMALRQTHQALRGKVEGAIEQIDRLLAANERH